MRITNTTHLDISRLKALIAFGARGCGPAGVEVHVKGTDGGPRGWCYQGIPDIANVATTSRYLITLLLPRTTEPSRWPKRYWNGHRLKRIEQKYPKGFPFDSWEDVVVYLAAHEFRHVWQVNRKRRARVAGRSVKGKCEYDAELFGFRRVNAWRVITGRDPIAGVKLPSPFEKRRLCGAEINSS